MAQQADDAMEQREQGAKRQGVYYGWLVAGASFCIVLLNTGVQQSFGNVLKPMSAEFGWDRATVSFPAAVAILWASRLMGGQNRPQVCQGRGSGRRHRRHPLWSRPIGVGRSRACPCGC